MRLRHVVLACCCIAISGCSAGDQTPRAASACAQKVTLFLEPGINAAREDRVLGILEDADVIDDFTYHSPVKEFGVFKRKFREQPEVFEEMNARDFPGRVEMTLQRDATLTDLNNQIGGTSGVDDILPRPCPSPTGTST